MGSVEVLSNDTFAALERYDVRVDDFKKDVGWVVSEQIWAESKKRGRLTSAGKLFVQTLPQTSHQRIV